jgi:hypothetical protein
MMDIVLFHESKPPTSSEYASVHRRRGKLGIVLGFHNDSAGAVHVLSLEKPYTFRRVARFKVVDFDEHKHLLVAATKDRQIGGHIPNLENFKSANYDLSRDVSEEQEELTDHGINIVPNRDNTVQNQGPIEEGRMSQRARSESSAGTQDANNAKGPEAQGVQAAGDGPPAEEFIPEQHPRPSLDDAVGGSVRSRRTRPVKVTRDPNFCYAYPMAVRMPGEVMYHLVFTKPLSHAVFSKHVVRLGLVSGKIQVME